MERVFILDSYAWIAYFRREPHYQKMAALFAAAEANELKILTSAINAGEVYYMLARKANKSFASKCLGLMQEMPGIFELPNWESVMRAADIKSKSKISFADAFAIELAVRKLGTLISDDPEILKLAQSDNFQHSTIANIAL